MRRKIFRIRISEEEGQRLTQLAKAWGCSRSEILRSGLKFIPMNRKGGALNSST
jgi:predicted DNA-binding protein